jgi:hypothetical protein
VKDMLSWIGDCITDPKRALPASIIANIALVVVMLSGIFVKVTWTDGHFRIEPVARTLEEQVDGLFADNKTVAQVRALLEGHGYFEVSPRHQSIEGIARALNELHEDHALVGELRQRAHRNAHPFHPKTRNVVVMPSEKASITPGEAQVCQQNQDLQDRFLVVWSPNNRGGFIVQATEAIDCDTAEANIVAVNRDDWMKLQMPDDAEVRATAKVYLHRPSDRPAKATAAFAQLPQT